MQRSKCDQNGRPRNHHDLPGCGNHVRLLAGLLAAMWHLLHRQHFKPVCVFYGAIPFAILAAVIIATCLSGLACEAEAQEELLSKTGQVNHPILIREHAGWNKDCDAIAHPALYLFEPPRHGSVCARIEIIKIHSMYDGTESQCIGRLVRGAQLIYRPDAGYAGNDGLRYAAQYPSVLRTVSVIVTVTTYPPGARSAVPSTNTAPMPQTRQSSGPVPACDELIF